MTDEAKVEKYVVAIQPGSAAESPLRFTIQENDLEKTIDEVIVFGLALNHSRKAQRIAEAITRERGRLFGITANGTTVVGTAQIKEYFTQRTAPDGKTNYMGVDIIVASKQTGGLGYTLRPAREDDVHYS